MGHNGFVLTGLEHSVLRNTYRVTESACYYSSSCSAAALRKASALSCCVASKQDVLMDFVQTSPATSRLCTGVLGMCTAGCSKICVRVATQSTVSSPKQPFHINNSPFWFLRFGRLIKGSWFFKTLVSCNRTKTIF